MTSPQIKMMLYDLQVEQRGLEASMKLHPDDKEGERALQLVNIKIGVVKQILEVDELFIVRT